MPTRPPVLASYPPAPLEPQAPQAQRAARRAVTEPRTAAAAPEAAADRSRCVSAPQLPAAQQEQEAGEAGKASRQQAGPSAQQQQQQEVPAQGDAAAQMWRELIASAVASDGPDETHSTTEAQDAAATGAACTAEASSPSPAEPPVSAVPQVLALCLPMTKTWSCHLVCLLRHACAAPTIP